MSRWQPNDDWRDERIRRKLAAKPRVMPEGLCETGKAMWTKAYGKGGTYQDAWKWHRFECIGCMFAQGLLKPSDRIQGRNPSNQLNQKPVEHRHDPKIHGNWLKAGKPIQK